MFMVQTTKGWMVMTSSLLYTLKLFSKVAGYLEIRNSVLHWGGDDKILGRIQIPADPLMTDDNGPKWGSAEVVMTMTIRIGRNGTVNECVSEKIGQLRKKNRKDKKRKA